LTVLADEGCLGVVLPRSIFTSAGTNEWRRELLAAGQIDELLTIVNTGQWFFPDVHPQYTIALVSYQLTKSPSDSFKVRGPYRSHADFNAGVEGAGADLNVEGVRSWTPGAAIPLLPSERSADVYRTMRSHPSFVAASQPWTVTTYNELHATADKVSKGGIIDVDSAGSPSLWPVYKGESFGLWQPWTGIAYGWADPEEAVRRLQQKRLRQVGKASGPFSAMSTTWADDETTLPCMNPRIAWRMVARATDTRSFYACLLPPKVLTAHHNYCLFFGNDDHERDEAYLLGVMCSIPFDWHARLWVEANFTASIVRPFPVPAALMGDPLRDRVEQIAGRLAAVDSRYGDWASAVGVPVASVSDGEREILFAELDANVAALYGLTREDLVTIFATFQDGWDYEPRLTAVLEHFERLGG
jgi:hypothetical protein